MCMELVPVHSLPLRPHHSYCCTHTHTSTATAHAHHTTEGMSAKDTEDSTPLGSPQLKRHLEELLAQDAKKKQQK